MNPIRLLVVASFSLCSTALAADLELARVFQSHMVVQRDQPLAVFGSAKPNAAVEVTFGEATASALAGSDGRFRVALGAYSKSAEGAPLVVASAGETITLEDVLVGEVWLCSGQSNMQWWLSIFADCKDAIGSANHSRIRLLRMHIADDSSQPTFDGRERREPGTIGVFAGRWEECTPETAQNFSAIAYSFGRLLERELDCPIGLIQNAVGGSPTEAWVSRPTLAADPKTAPMLVNWTESPLIHPWCTGGGKEALAQRAKQLAEAQAKGAAPPPEQHYRFEPSALFDGGIVPLAGLSFQGVIWYQGESNSHDVALFESLMQKMLADWRANFGRTRFPFLYVQLAAWGPGDTWPELRAAQARLADSDPDAAMVTAIDLGDKDDIHPPGKLVVGERLARAALARLYGKAVEWQSPRFTTLSIPAAAASDRVSLVVQVAADSGLATTDGAPPRGFEIAGDDGTFAPADARLDGRSIILSATTVKNPRSARYAWAANPALNVVSAKTRLPLLPFHADGAAAKR